jgi:hypothetical protein
MLHLKVRFRFRETDPLMFKMQQSLLLEMWRRDSKDKPSMY